MYDNLMPKSFDKTKDLFVHLMKLNSYDVFTSSVLSIHYNNGLSLNILLRAQIENFFLTQFIVDNPDEIQDILKEEIWKSKKSKLWSDWFKSKQREEVGQIYNCVLSKVAHPLPANFLVGTTFMSAMIPKKNSGDMTEFFKLTPENRTKRLSEFFDLDFPSPGLSAVPHNSMSKESRDARIYDVINFYVKVLENLGKIGAICPDHKIKPEDWKAIMKDHKKL
jgi:hypothetical protein